MDNILEIVMRMSQDNAARILPTTPGLSPGRLCALMRDAISGTRLDLTGMTLLTEAASGPYAVTPVIAAMANARRVHAVTKSTQYGSVAEITEWTMTLASLGGVADRISISESIDPNILSQVNVVTNSGHLRPIDSVIIDQLRVTSVIALMYEAWEFRTPDIDAQACRRRGIPIVGVNENHVAVDVFSYLGPLCVKLLHDAGIPVYRNRIALLCDNGFAQPIVRGLAGLGANVHHASKIEELHRDTWDAIVVALRPSAKPRIGASEARYLSSQSAPTTIVVQFWGDLDREALRAANLHAWPPSPPPPGHMAILLSAIGPDAVVRLQTGGLRAAECVFRGDTFASGHFAQLVDLGTA